eukprot:3738067-Amphidinium_carterae.1
MDPWSALLDPLRFPWETGWVAALSTDLGSSPDLRVQQVLGEASSSHGRQRALLLRSWADHVDAGAREVQDPEPITVEEQEQDE